MEENRSSNNFLSNIFLIHALFQVVEMISNQSILSMDISGNKLVERLEKHLYRH